MLKNLPRLIHDSVGKSHLPEVNWITNHVLKSVPSWYRKRLHIVSLGAGDGYIDYLLSNELAAKGCNIESYVLVEPETLSPTFDSSISANKIKRIPHKMQDVKLANLITLAIYCNSLHHDINSLSNFSTGPYGAALTFIVGNAKFPWYTDPEKGAFEKLVNIFGKADGWKFSKDILPAVVDVTNTPELFEEMIKSYKQVSATAGDMIQKEEIEKVQKEYERKREAKESPLMIDFSKVYQSVGGVISRAEKNPIYDNFIAWKKSGYGPGYD